MSRTRYKTTFKSESGYYGEVEEHTLYADYNNSCDIVTFYNENFDIILQVGDTVENNLIEALIRIWNHNSNNPIENVENWSFEDKQKFEKINS